VGADGTTGSFELDDVRFETDAPVDRGPKNLTVLPAAPPAKTDLGDITIDTPLQQKALAQLDRGYNLTNWLEEGRFQSFEFDEAYVEKLSNAGFKALRLPIDLDQYVTEASGTGDEVTLTLHDDLWTILDSFDEWTEAYGLSFTIDYHQYDKSFAFSNTAGVDQAVALWRAVAEHFKDSPRDDIYFELLNEPELSTGASAILPATSWTPVAQRMIDAIRSEDTTHTIIFGDVNWYGIDQLSVRTPFEDDNIVYSFHSYEPFIFTHQGADWAQSSTTHDVPFPYTPERWSEYSSDLGLTSAQPSWIWNQFQTYNVNGTAPALYNRVAKAKAWAVEHQVPIICNEFGVYERTSLLEDRVAYYNALIGTFNELEIPWQIWFMIMDQDGTVIPEYVEAFKLEE
jgi:licheninase